MSTAQHTPRPLRAGCMRVLQANNVSAQLMDASTVTLHDGNGDWLFHVHKNIQAVDLRTMLRLHRERFSAGERAGREGAFEALRAFIGVDAAIARAKGSAD